MIVQARRVEANITLVDVVDLLQPDQFTPVTGVIPVQVQVQVTWQNVVQPWPLVSGVGVTDTQVTSGKVYWNELPGATGAYGVRFRPHAVGTWSLLFTYAPTLQRVRLTYDVVPSDEGCSPGTKVSFVGRGC